MNNSKKEKIVNLLTESYKMLAKEDELVLANDVKNIVARLNNKNKVNFSGNTGQVNISSGNAQINAQMNVNNKKWW